MSDFVSQLRRDPYALSSIKPNNPVLTQIFLAIPEGERRGIPLPERGYLVKQFLEEWGKQQAAKRRGEAPEDFRSSQGFSEDSNNNMTNKTRRAFLQFEEGESRQNNLGRRKFPESTGSRGRVDSGGFPVAEEILQAGRRRFPQGNFEGKSGEFSNNRRNRKTIEHEIPTNKQETHNFEHEEILSSPPHHQARSRRVPSPRRALSDDEQFSTERRRSFARQRDFSDDFSDSPQQPRSARRSQGFSQSRGPRRPPVCSGCQAKARQLSRVSLLCFSLLDQLENFSLDFRGQLTRALAEGNSDDEENSFEQENRGEKFL